MKKNFLLREKKYSTGLSKNRFTRSIQFPEWENGSVQAKIIKASVTYIPNLLFFRAVGTLLGWIFGGIGWLFLAGLAVTVFGLALIAVPVVLVIGLVALIAAAVS